MAKRKFLVTFSGTAQIELDDAVFNAVDEAFKNSIYEFDTSEEVAEHIAYNMIVNDAKLSQLDGWADQPDEHASVTFYPNWEIEAEEIL
jgi:hypothetical protein